MQLISWWMVAVRLDRKYTNGVFIQGEMKDRSMEYYFKRVFVSGGRCEFIGGYSKDNWFMDNV